MFELFRSRSSTLGLPVVLASFIVGGVAVADTLSRGPSEPDRLDAEVVWQIQLPARQTMSFRSFLLLEGRIYAMGTDNSVLCVLADTGEVAWSRKLADEGETLWPPVMYRTREKHAIVFALLDRVVLLDPKTGVTLETMKLSKPAVCPVAVAPGRVFVAQANGRLAAYRLRDGYVFWRAAFEDRFTLAPLYAPAINAVVAVDTVGLVAGLRNEHRVETRVIFKQLLWSRPSGTPAMDGDVLYLTTDNQTLHVIDMGRDEDSQAGDIVWQYRLAKRPSGGPLVSATAVYQATEGGGLHRIPKTPGEFRAWFDPQGLQVLSEWPQGVVVLRTDGSLALIGDDPDRPIALGSAGGFVSGLSNLQNDAIFLTDNQGSICCIRPAGAAPLQLASFVPEIKGELPAEPDEPTEIDRLRESARKKREKLAGIVPEPEPAIPVKDEPKTPEAEADAPVAAAPAEPYDPLRSKRPVVR